MSGPGMLEPAVRRDLPAAATVSLWLGVAALAALVLVTSYTGFQPTATLAATAIGLVVLAWRRTLLAWPTLLGLTIAVVLFVPARRYVLGDGLPFALEPYRVLIAVVLTAWALALLVDARTRLRRTGLELPVLLLVGAIACSLAFNADRVAALSGTVSKGVVMFVGLLLVMYFVASVVDRRPALDGAVMLLVIGTTIVALCAVAEWRTGYNAFDRLAGVLPLLDSAEGADVGTLERGTRPRAYASAQHAIALGAALVVVMPLAVYLYRRTGRFAWMAAAAVLTLGAMASGSRTAVVMLATAFVAFLVAKPRATARLAPLLLPLFMVVQIVMPGTLGTFRAVFFPEHGLLAQQQAGAGEAGSGRLADIGPSLEQWAQTPLFGQGFQTRLTSARDSEVNALILDNQWLGMLLETGALGFAALAWLLARAVRRLGRLARGGDDEPLTWLLAALCASIAAFAIGMFLYDAFSFAQVSFLLFLLLGLSSVAIRLSTEDARGSRTIRDARVAGGRGRGAERGSPTCGEA